MAKNEKTSKDIASIAARGLKDPKSLSGTGKGAVAGGKSSSRGASRERDHQGENQRDGNNAPNRGRQSSGTGGVRKGGLDRDEDHHDQGELEAQEPGASGRGSSSNNRPYAPGGADSGVKEGWEMHMEAALAQLKEENRKLLERVSVHCTSFALIPFC